MSGWHGRDGRRSIHGLMIFQVVLFSVCVFPHERHNLWGVGLVWFICWWWNWHFLSYTRTRGPSSCASTSCSAGPWQKKKKEEAAIIRRVWVKEWSGRTFLLPEQMLYYTTLVYLRLLRSVHQTWPWRLFRRRCLKRRPATCRRHCKTACVTL